MLDCHITPQLAHRDSSRTIVPLLLALRNLRRNLAIQIPGPASRGAEMQPSAATWPRYDSARESHRLRNSSLCEAYQHPIEGLQSASYVYVRSSDRCFAA